MKNGIILTALAVLSVQTACTPKPLEAQPPVQRERLAYLQKVAATPVTCTAGADCIQKWTRALEWVSIHSVYSIKTHTDGDIVTNGPIEPTTDAAFAVRKTAQDATTSVITFSADCGKAPQCNPTVLESQASFTNYVLYGING